MIVASSYDDRQILVFDPEAGLEIPICLDLDKKTFDVRLPTANELKNDFRREENRGALTKRFPQWSALIEWMFQFSKEATSLFTKSELEDLTILEIRSRVFDAFIMASKIKTAKVQVKRDACFEAQQTLSGGSFEVELQPAASMMASRHFAD